MDITILEINYNCHSLLSWLQMQSVDPDGALKMYMEAGEWDKCLEVAKQQVSSPGPHPSVLRNIISQSITLPFCALKVLPYLSKVYVAALSVCVMKYCLIFLPVPSEILLYPFSCVLRNLLMSSQIITSSHALSLLLCLTFLPFHRELVYWINM